MELEDKLFAQKLLHWNRYSNKRKMPWKGEKNPYYIWLSEIILQQTRVEQGWEYYLKFKKKYPTVNKLAAAPEDEVMQLWQGLGYYSRARNLHTTAKMIMQQYHGEFPQQYDEILKLKGVGKYTAAAISSFAFNLPYAVVDGNVIRILSRVFDLSIPFDSASGQEYFRNLAQNLLDVNHPAKFNQAIMDFGATVCTPINPLCSGCIMADICKAVQLNKVDQLPVKAKKIMKKNRYFLFEVFIHEGRVLIERREDNDIWKSLYQFPKIELTEKEFKEIDLPLYTQLLTHQKIFAKFKTSAGTANAPKQGIWADIKRLKKFGFPKIISIFIESNNLKIDRHV